MQFYHIFTIKFWHRPINENDLLQTMNTYTKRDTNERKDTNVNQSPTDFKHAAIIIYIWGEIFLVYNVRI